MLRLSWLFALFCSLTLWGAGPSSARPARIPTRTFRVIQKFPHDPQAFTQGLVFYQGRLYESTGQYGLSELRCVEIKTGRVLQSHSLSSDWFGEGIALQGGQIFQLTWMSRICLVYDRESLAVQRIVPVTHSNQGWGLAWDGHNLIASDGSPRLYFLDPSDLSLRRTLKVTAAGIPLEHLNELEVADNHILANIWQDTRIAEISPLSGRVTAWIDCRSLVPAGLRNDSDRVLNGIAAAPKPRRLYVTGKNWPVLFLIELDPLP